MDSNSILKSYSTYIEQFNKCISYKEGENTASADGYEHRQNSLNQTFCRLPLCQVSKIH